jgi:YidC/Oxa1 family membrane protein insertase
MKLYNKAGVNPMAGCIPTSTYIYALFQFFPSAISLRQKDFFMIYSFDSIYELPFHVPLYGNHISLFPILASIAIFFYENDNGDQQMAGPTQEGMPIWLK